MPRRKQKDINYEDLKLLSKAMEYPNMSIKYLNQVYAIRNAWASRRFLIDRERQLLAIICNRFEHVSQVKPQHTATDKTTDENCNTCDKPADNCAQAAAKKTEKKVKKVATPQKKTSTRKRTATTTAAKPAAKKTRARKTTGDK